MSILLDSVCQTLSAIAPIRRAESWDNVGLLVGDRKQPISRVMTCLTVTPSVVAEALERRVDLIVAHHPLPFRPLARLTTDSIPGQMLWRLIGARVAIYSAHTAFDSAALGINQRWAESLGLQDIGPITEPAAENELGSGRLGVLPEPSEAGLVIRTCGQLAGASGASLRGVGPLDQKVSKVGFACGSGGSFVADARRGGCELLITGEATFHQCLEAEALGMTLGLLGHYQSERFAMERLAEHLSAEWPDLSIWPSDCEQDPIRLLR